MTHSPDATSADSTPAATAAPPTLLTLLRRRLLSYAVSGPVTLVMIACAWIIHLMGINAVFGPESYLEKVAISELSTQTVQGLVPATLGLLLLGIPAERALGTWRYLLAAILSQTLAVGTAVTLGELWTTHSGWAHGIATGTILTPAVWLLAVSMLAATRYTVVWRRRVQFFSVVIAVVLLLYSGTLQDVAIAIAVAGCGILTARHWDWQATVREKRRISAITVFAVAIGPFLAAMNPHSNAVFSSLGLFVTSPAWSLDSAEEVCAHARHSAACMSAASSVNNAGIAPFLGNVAVALVFGVLAALYRDSWIDQIIRVFSIIFVATPSFWLAVLLIQAFTINNDILPASGPLIAFESDPRAYMMRMLMPAFALGIPVAGSLIRVVRTSMVEELDKDYVRTALGAGIPKHIVVARNVLRNALITPVTVLGLRIGYLMGGAVIIEVIFALPGMGQAILEGIQSNYADLVQGVTLTVALAFVVVNIVVDMLYILINPRIRTV